MTEFLFLVELSLYFGLGECGALDQTIYCLLYIVFTVHSSFTLVKIFPESVTSDAFIHSAHNGRARPDIPP